MRFGRHLGAWRQLLLGLLAACSACSAAEIVVGGDRGWTLGAQYRDVYARPGDVLVRRAHLGCAQACLSCEELSILLLLEVSV